MSGGGDTVLRVRRARNLTAPLDALVGKEAADRDLSWKAVGLLTYLVTRPDGWKFYKADLVSRHADGKSAVESGLRELREAGFLEMDQQRTEAGTFRTNWTVSDRPLGGRTGKSDPDRTGFSAHGFSAPDNRGTEVTDDEESGDDEGVGSSLWDSPGGPGEEGEDDDFDPLNWYLETPTSDAAPTRHWNRGVARLWRPSAEQLDVQGGWPACSAYLKRLGEEWGSTARDVSAFVVGLSLVRDAGDLPGVDPGEGFGHGLPSKACAESWTGPDFWHAAQEAFREEYKDSESVDPQVRALFTEAETAGV